MKERHQQEQRGLERPRDGGRRGFKLVKQSDTDSAMAVRL